jgi:hypothetical protein
MSLMPMRSFNNPPAALDYVVDSLIPKRRGFIINIAGPAEVVTNYAATLQVVDQNRVYGDGEYGLTLHLPFDPASGSHESYTLFQEFAKHVPFDDVSYSDFPCYATKFGTDVNAALHILAAVLHKVFEYPELTTFECEVYED